jgi:hypothetical protein
MSLMALAVAAGVSTMQAAMVDFSADPGWTGSNNHTNGNHYGYNAGAMQAGGAIARNATDSFYGDTGLGQTLTLDGKITASGKFIIRHISEGWISRGSSGFFIGHFSKNPADSSREFIGLEFREDGETTMKVRARFQVPAGTGGADSEFMTVSADATHSFQYSYDPGLGEEGDTTPDGRLTVTIDGKTIFVNLSNGERNSGAQFDAFGMGATNNQHSQPAEDKTAQVFIDDVSYSGRAEPAASQ